MDQARSTISKIVSISISVNPTITGFALSFHPKRDIIISTPEMTVIAKMRTCMTRI